MSRLVFPYDGSNSKRGGADELVAELKDGGRLVGARTMAPFVTANVRAVSRMADI